MADVHQTEFTSFAYAEESSYGRLTSGGDWKGLEPEGVSRWGNDYRRERRDPFNVDRLMRRQKLTGFSAMASIDGDATNAHLEMLVPAMLLADWQADFETFKAVAAAADITANVITSDATGQALLKDGAIVRAGFTANGIVKGDTYRLAVGTANKYALWRLDPDSDSRVKEASAALPLTGSAIAATDNLEFEIVGWSITAGTAADSGFTVATAAGTGITITQGTAATARTDYSATALKAGFAAGRGLYIAFGEDSPDTINRFIGFARSLPPSSQGTGVIAAEHAEETAAASVALLSTAGAQGETHRVYVFLSRWIKNVPADDAKWDDGSIALAAKYAGLRTGASGDTYELMTGCHLNSLSLSLSQQSRIRFSADFMAQAKRTLESAEADPHAATGFDKDSFDSADDPDGTDALATSIDVARARLISVKGDSEVTTLIRSVELTMEANIEGNYVIDKPQAIGPQIGKFGLSATIEALVASTDQLTAVEDETPGSLQVACGSGDGWWLFDIPAMTLTGDQKNFERNRTLTIAYEADYYPDDAHRTGIIVSRFPWLPIQTKTFA